MSGSCNENDLSGQSDHSSPFDDSEDLSYPGHDWRILYMAASLFSVSRVSSDTVERSIDPCELIQSNRRPHCS